MADVAGAFLRGQQAGQAQLAHKQQLEENKIRLMVLKHSIDRIKLEDQLRAREISMQNAQLLHGQPEADLPQEAVTQTNLPADSHAGAMGLPDVISGLVRERMGADGGPAPSAAPVSMAAPNAQAAQPGTNDLARRTAAVSIPGVEALGVPGVSVRPQSMEDLVRQAVVAKFNEPFTLTGDQKRFVGGHEIASGPGRAPTQVDIAKKAAEGDPDAMRVVGLLHPPRQTAGEPLVATEGPNGPVLTPRSKAAGMKPAARPSTRQPADPGIAQKRDYDEFYKVYVKAHPEPKPEDVFTAQVAGSAAPERPLPPPSFEKWKAMTPAERQRVISEPAARIDDTEMQRRGSGSAAATQPKSTSVPPAVATFLKGKATNKRYTLTDGTVWDVLPDGSIRPGPTK